MMRSSVVFPQPDGPRKHTNSPGSTDRLTPRSAMNTPNFLAMPSRATAAGRVGSAMLRHHLEEARAVALGLVRPDAVGEEQVVHRARLEEGDVAQRPVARHHEGRDSLRAGQAEPMPPERLEQRLRGGG